MTHAITHPVTQSHFADAIALLKADHRHFDDLFEAFGKSRWPVRRQSVAHQICTELAIHINLEEDLFYPALRGRVADDLLDRALARLDETRILMRLVETANPRDEFYAAKMHVLAQSVRSHVQEEELFQHGLFARCRRAAVDLVTLGKAMIARRGALVAQARPVGLPMGRNGLRLVAAA